MSDPTPDAVMRRLDRLERENRRLKRTGLLALLGIVAVALMAQAFPQERIVEAKAFKLTDTNGVTAQPAGDTLRFYDSRGNPRLTLGVGAYGPVLTLSDPDGTHA